MLILFYSSMHIKILKTNTTTTTFLKLFKSIHEKAGISREAAESIPAVCSRIFSISTSHNACITAHRKALRPTSPLARGRLALQIHTSHVDIQRAQRLYMWEESRNNSGTTSRLRTHALKSKILNAYWCAKGARDKSVSETEEISGAWHCSAAAVSHISTHKQTLGDVTAVRDFSVIFGTFCTTVRCVLHEDAQTK